MIYMKGSNGKCIADITQKELIEIYESHKKYYMEFKEPIFELNNLIHTNNKQDCINFYEAEYKCEIQRNGAFEVHYTTIRIRPELVKNILLKGTIEELYNNFNVR